MKLVIRICMYLALPVFVGGAMFAMTMIPDGSGGTNGDAQVKEESLKRIKTLTVHPQQIEETVLLPGTVEAYEDVDIGAAIPGVVEQVYVKEGGRVKKGQELFQIDLRSREARLQDAKAAYELAQKNLERKKNLRKRGDVTIQEYDEAVAQEQRAAAIQRTMEVDVSLGHVYAPMEGIIDKIHAEVGEYMHEGTQLARLLAMDKVKVITGVPELHTDAAAREKSAQVFLDALGEVREASLERIAFEANQQTNTFEATLVLDNKDHRIRPGMIVRVGIVTKRVPDALMVPMNALVKRENGMVLFVERNGIIESRPVKMGAFQKQFVEIQEGLLANDNVVVIGQQDVVDGQQVEVLDRIALDAETVSEGVRQ